ncbi:ATP-binding protein [Amylibacter sp. SFDW26]|uniref:ATP-binding protein n=1 Tax=Amylibacter sp. SFDW26 TaxID=2652722 RepID=UPI001869D43B|nr:ATP-binding protein [Amylibacter sp. SFDW26]
MTNCQDLVPNLLDEIQEWMCTVNVQEGHITDVQIVLAEALNNVIEHGFEHENTGELEIKIEVSEVQIIAHICDNGLAFTPPDNSQTPLQVDDDLKTLPEGGFGWFLIKEVTSHFEFHRCANKNQLILFFD